MPVAKTGVIPIVNVTETESVHTIIGALALVDVIDF